MTANLFTIECTVLNIKPEGATIKALVAFDQGESKAAGRLMACIAGKTAVSQAEKLGKGARIVLAGALQMPKVANEEGKMIPKPILMAYHISVISTGAPAAPAPASAPTPAAAAPAPASEPEIESQAEPDNEPQPETETETPAPVTATKGKGKAKPPAVVEARADDIPF